MMLWLMLMAAMPQGPAGVDDGICAARAADLLVGEHYRRGVPSRAKRLSGARTVRVMMPGMMETEDFRADRITLRVDHRRRVAAVRCG